MDILTIILIILSSVFFIAISLFCGRNLKLTIKYNKIKSINDVLVNQINDLKNHINTLEQELWEIDNDRRILEAHGQTYEEDIKRLEDKRLALESEINALTEAKMRYEQMQEENNKLNTTNSHLLEEINNNKTTILTDQRIINELKTSIDQLTTSKQAAENSFNESHENFKRILDDQQQKYNLQEKNLKAQQNKLREVADQITDAQKIYDTLMVEVNRYESLKVEQSQLYAATIIANEREKQAERKGIIELNANNLEVIELIETICRQFPSMREDLSRLCWSKIWLPKMQDVVARNGVSDKTAGIYKLSVVGDEAVCYIGQATDIKTRWYTHAKKMVGVESSKGERLYERVKRPDEVKWEVVEVVSDGVKDVGAWLDEHEKYWIEFYGCVEIGLNKKK